MGRSKEFTLNAWKERPEASELMVNVDSAWLLDFATMRRTEEGAKPATIQSDISILRSVFSVGKTILKAPVTTAPFDEARDSLRKLNLASKSEERERRPEIDEIDAIMKQAYAARSSVYTRARDHAPHDKLIVFQMFSAFLKTPLTIGSIPI